jgi:hypothetical protein
MMTIAVDEGGRASEGNSKFGIDGMEPPSQFQEF